MAPATPISIGQFRDLDRYRAAVRKAPAYGATGCLCIHPGQVTAANAEFRSDAVKRDVLDAWESAQKKRLAVTKCDGHMIDLPVVTRVRRILEQSFLTELGA